MERAWAYASLLGVSMLWAGGFGESFWRRHGVRPRAAAAFGLAIGASGWLPPWRGVSVGALIAGVAVVCLAGRFRRALPVVGLLGVGAVWILLEQVTGASPALWSPLLVDALSFGLTAGLAAPEPAVALATVVVGAGLGALGSWIGLPHPAPGSRALVARMVVGALSGWAVGYAFSWRKRPTIGQGGRRWP